MKPGAARLSGFAPDMSYEAFFARGTGRAPYPWQVRAAMSAPADLIAVPTGCGKSEGVVVPWLWRLATGQPAPTRLVLVLPRRVLCTDLEARVVEFLERLKVRDKVAVLVLMGGSQRDRRGHQLWRMNPQQPTVVIGTIDAVLSSLLHRGYFSTRSAATMDFALLANDAHIVLDEGHLSDQALATLRQMSAFQAAQGTVGPVDLTIMSATLDADRLDTVDNPASGCQTLTLGPADEESSLRPRLLAGRTLHELTSPTAARIAAHVMQRHHPGTISLVVCNTVASACSVFMAITKVVGDEPTLLVHSRFRAAERARLQDSLNSLRAGGGIVVSTQSLEAGVDLDARLLVTEASPIASFAQRVGRCNRAGALTAEEAEIWWCAQLTPKASPYDPAEVDALATVLRAHEGQAVTSKVLAGWRAALPAPDLIRRVLRMRDHLQLFDTTPDIAGDDVDVRPFISPDDDTDVAIAWVADHDLDPDALALRARRPPAMEALCPVSLTAARAFVGRSGVKAAAFRNEMDRWRVLADGSQVRPRDVLLVAGVSGGYDTVLGFSPELRTPVEPWAPDDASPDADGTESEAGAASEEGAWVPLQEHLDDTRRQADALLRALPGMADAGLADAVREAAGVHDWGKAHADWQGILAPEGALPEGGPWAKAPRHDGKIPLTASGRRGLRHEVITALMLLSDEGQEALSARGVAPHLRSLIAYLAAAHHGKLRASVWDPRRDGHSGDAVYGLKQGDTTPALEWGGLSLPERPVDLALLTDGGGAGWAALVDDLLADHGPFRLAYLEALVRAADWRASAGVDLVETS